MSKYRVVLDTNVLVSALLTPNGNPATIYKLVSTGVLPWFLSVAIAEEYQDVLLRPRLHISPAKIAIVFKAIRKRGNFIIPAKSDIFLPDEDDRVFYDTAISAGAFLITGNKKHFTEREFILSPTEFMGI